MVVGDPISSLHAKLVAPESTQKTEWAAAIEAYLKWLDQLHSEHVKPPSMGTVKPLLPHREKCPDHSKLVMPSFAVARKVPKRESGQLRKPKKPLLRR
jgi:hypothetical protein